MNQKILQVGKFSTFEEMKAAFPSEPISDEEKEKRHLQWISWVESLRNNFIIYKIKNNGAETN